MEDFIGVKIALLIDDKVIVIRRDKKPGLRYAGMWDLPGGGRENAENPFDCVARELEEELNIYLTPESIIWQKQYPALHDANKTAYFMVAKVNATDIDSIKFGDEGQGWKLMPIDEFMVNPKVIEPFKNRLQFYLESITRWSNP